MKVRLRDFVVLVIILSAVAIVATAGATDKPRGDRITQSNDNNSQTTGDVAVGVETVVNGGDLIGGDTVLSTSTKNVAVAAPGCW